MSKPSSSKLIFLRFLYQQRSTPLSPPKPPISSTPISQILHRNPWSPLSHRPHFMSSSISKISQNPSQKLPLEANLSRNLTGVGSSQTTHFTSSSISRVSQPSQTNLIRNFIGFRYISTGSSNLGGKLDVNLLKSKVKEPATAVKKAFSRYKQAVGLQMEAFWRRNSMVLLGAGGVFVCILLWRIMFGIANTFIGLSEGIAKYGFLALSSAIVAFAGLYLRSRFTINPDKVYRMAMTKLNTSADILEIMGAPLTGTDLRAYVMSGGGITLKNFKAALRSKRCFLIFPIRGAEMKGLVSVEVKNKKGKYDMKLLSVDIPMATGPDQRLFLIGDEEEYRVGGGLISELRDPVVKAMAAAKEFEARDIIEDKEDAERELAEAERKHREEVEKIEREGS
ncbi:uncharacterized protein LOC112524563 [Cynara cardunculus var. scolymus]|uniref:Uncharacterized protein n=1 Tax=Cynara cardunculus var. scolymus TaxID=59895 RepID=A0A103YJ31_CYNCS|nr:uncharacterized protein LOC112524563 [Cynara cardunculus var. scolymus]KVI10041.1 hypothetical protein Ccrd_011565 [Cynara cardunculus var. scolymus]